MKQILQKITDCFLLLIVVMSFSCNKKNPFNKTVDLLDGIDSTVRPQDDFYNYVNGGWIKKTNIPPSEYIWGTIEILDHNTQEILKDLLDSCASLKATKGSNEQKLGDFYASAMDSNAIEQKGFKPLQLDMQRISTIKSLDDVLKEVSTEYKMGLSPLFNLYVSEDDKNSQQMVAHFDEGGLGLPKDYYSQKDVAIISIRTGYLHYITKLFMLSGDDSVLAKKEASSVMKIESALANTSKTLVEKRSAGENYNKMSIQELSVQSTNFNWSVLLKSLGMTQDTVLVGQPAFYTALNRMLQSVPVNDWKSYLRFHFINFYAYELSSPFVNEAFQFDKLFTGQTELQPRWKRMTWLTNIQLGDGLGQLYVKKYFPPESKQKVLELINNVQQTCKERIQSLNWMSDSTKQKTVAKLDAMAKKVGYPDKWRDYSLIDINRDDFIQNLKNIGHYNYQHQINKLGKPVDRSEWFAPPVFADGRYDKHKNDITFFTVLLQPPFFYVNGDDALNYGGIGSVIGHEITHGFDDQGRLFDALGNLSNWWSSSDSANFRKRADRVVNQYSKTIAIDTLHLNGELTQGENIADIGGLAIAYDAFKKSKGSTSGKIINGLTPEQRFFIAYARVNRVKITPEILRTAVLTNDHSPPQYRVNNSLSDLPAFYTAFDVKPRDKMYVPDSVRAQVW